MRTLQVLKVPVRALFSTLAENKHITDISLTTRKTANKRATLLSPLSLGDNFPVRVEDVVVEIPLISLSPPVPNSTNDNYCIMDPPVQVSSEDQSLSDKIQTVNSNVVFPVLYVTGQSQKKDISPNQSQEEIKCVKVACCVNHCLCPHNVTSVHHVVENPPVGGCLQKFWQVWLSLGSNPRVVSILKEGYSLPFKVRPPSVKVTGDNQSLCKSGQEQVPQRILTGTDPKTGYFWYQSPTTSGGPS